MSSATDLVRAILRGYCGTEQAARHVLEEALTLEVEPFEFFAHRFGIDMADVVRRAASWAGLMYVSAPALTDDSVPECDLDGLGGMRLMPARLAGSPIVYIAPGFTDILRLRRTAERNLDYRRRVRVVAGPALRRALVRAHAPHLMERARQYLARCWPRANASLSVTRGRRAVFVTAVGLLVGLTVGAAFASDCRLVWPVDALLILPGVFRLAALAFMAFPGRGRVALLEDADLPIYSVLVPLRDEAAMVPQLYTAMARLDYPPEKLDIKFVVESRSAETIAAVERVLVDPRFEMIVVPDSAPRTKPKALNFALPLTVGEHVVVYDAEDIPDPRQLRLAASRFAAEPGLECLQAELVLDNAGEGALTALFAGEYAAQFGVLLPALARWGLPMPLGGTSNHFRRRTLMALGAWDSFNVTEDADLGIRLARRGLRCDVLASRTREEAPVTIRAWVGQRTRWMKGWMQTIIVHGHAPRSLFEELGWGGFVSLHLHVGSMLVSAPLHTAFLASLALRTFVLPPMEADWTLAAVNWGVALVGYGSAVALVVAGLARQRALHLLPAQLLLPIYWLLFPVALFRAARGLMAAPHFWAKTQHGRTRVERETGRDSAHRGSVRSKRASKRHGRRVEP